ncbi:Uncharacterized protein ChrSV_3936 [Chromobacterium vaccinii]|nr:Uncharacterized protein ChrSW_3936 [Chromobacterium vaccinii]QND91393.1 Uncharacterized protein ChrSV_3936 [Chromobacterium vaccinii]
MDARAGPDGLAWDARAVSSWHLDSPRLRADMSPGLLSATKRMRGQAHDLLRMARRGAPGFV